MTPRLESQTKQTKKHQLERLWVLKPMKLGQGALIEHWQVFAVDLHIISCHFHGLCFMEPKRMPAVPMFQQTPWLTTRWSCGILLVVFREVPLGTKVLPAPNSFEPKPMAPWPAVQRPHLCCISAARLHFLGARMDVTGSRPPNRAAWIFVKCLWNFYIFSDRLCTPNLHFRSESSKTRQGGKRRMEWSLRKGGTKLYQPSEQRRYLKLRTPLWNFVQETIITLKIWVILETSWDTICIVHKTQS